MKTIFCRKNEAQIGGFAVAKKPPNIEIKIFRKKKFFLLKLALHKLN